MFASYVERTYYMYTSKQAHITVEVPSSVGRMIVCGSFVPCCCRVFLPPRRCPGFVLRPSIDVLPSAANDWQLYFADSGANITYNFTEDRTFDSNILYPGFYWWVFFTPVPLPFFFFMFSP